MRKNEFFANLLLLLVFGDVLDYYWSETNPYVKSQCIAKILFQIPLRFNFFFLENLENLSHFLIVITDELTLPTIIFLAHLKVKTCRKAFIAIEDCAVEMLKVRKSVKSRQQKPFDSIIRDITARRKLFASLMGKLLISWRNLCKNLELYRSCCHRLHRFIS